MNAIVYEKLENWRGLQFFLTINIQEKQYLRKTIEHLETIFTNDTLLLLSDFYNWRSGIGNHCRSSNVGRKVL